MAGNLGNWRVPKTPVNQEGSLKDLVNKISYLAQPENVDNFMRKFTGVVDNELVRRLKSLSKTEHPKDTGLLQESWQVPAAYLQNHSGKSWQVYAENTATIGEWKLRKSKLGKTYKVKNRRGNVSFRNNRRYLRYVESKTGFYSKQLRVIKQEIPGFFTRYVNMWLRLMWEGGYISQQEYRNVRG